MEKKIDKAKKEVKQYTKLNIDSIVSEMNISTLKMSIISFLP